MFSLQELRLEEYMDTAAKWCSEMGAVSLEEIAENIEAWVVLVPEHLGPSWVSTRMLLLSTKTPLQKTSNWTSSD